MDEAVLKKRVDDLLERGTSVVISSEVVAELFQGALTVMGAVYGPQSNQVVTLCKSVRAEKMSWDQGPIVLGSLLNLKRELEAGLAGSLQKRITGDVLTDFIQLARAALDKNEDGAKNVAAVLAAAAFEDTIRRMGATLGGVVGRDDLSKVINTLKDKEILQPPQLGMAVSYLKFRNDALHADWDLIDRAGVNSVLGFVEQLLLKHFQ